MGLPFNGDRLQAAAALGMGELRGAYNDRKREIALKARHKRQLAKTKIERERIKAVEAKEMADLERGMYEAKLAAQQAQERTRLARRATGTYTPGERLGMFARGAVGVGRGAVVVGGAFYKGLQTPPKKRATTRKRSTGSSGKTLKTKPYSSVRKRS